MRKNYVLDTNVLLYDPGAIFRFEDNDIYIPIFVIEEVDKFKREGGERGRNARSICRHLDRLREERGSLADGVELESGGSLRVIVPSKRPQLAAALDDNAQDQAILQTALQISQESPNVNTIFVTMDTNLRIRADAVGVATETYENRRVEFERVRGSVTELLVERQDVDEFYHGGRWASERLKELPANACVMLKSNGISGHSALARLHADLEAVAPLRVPTSGVLGLRPRNREQTFALDLLLDDQIRLVTIMGKAGTGKTLLALAAGLLRTLEEARYSKLLVSRPVIPMGKDLGYLPGDVEEKLNPWMQPIFDNLEWLYASHKDGGAKDRQGRNQSRGYEELLERGLVQVEPLSYIRGRSLTNQYLIVDEAQNLTPHEVKTIITRAGEGTKVVLTGDPFQIDNPYVDSATNGLTVTAHRFQGQTIAGNILLTKGERSPLAELAANLLLRRSAMNEPMVEAQPLCLSPCKEPNL